MPARGMGYALQLILVSNLLAGIFLIIKIRGVAEEAESSKPHLYVLLESCGLLWFMGRSHTSTSDKCLLFPNIRYRNFLLFFSYFTLKYFSALEHLCLPSQTEAQNHADACID